MNRGQVLQNLTISTFSFNFAAGSHLVDQERLEHVIMLIQSPMELVAGTTIKI